MVAADTNADGGQLGAGDGGASRADAAADGRGSGPADGGATPADSGATPADSGATPADSGATPTDSGATPVDGGATSVDGGGEGGCTTASACAECTSDDDCSSELICVSQQCSSPRCGDGVITAPEECDPRADGTQNDPWHCSADCERMAIYVPCTQKDDCLPETEHGTTCVETVSGETQCIPGTGLELDEYGIPLQRCPQLSAHSYTQKFFSNIGCVLECVTEADCPPQLTRCSVSPFAGATENEAARVCEP